jgi:methionine synthase II (cobalamin-independent)
VTEAVRTSFGELGDGGIPYLPELPDRGPGGDLIGRGAVFLTETPVDLQPSGWRLVSRPGRDLERARSMLQQDLDVLAEVADGYHGPLKVQVTGPWTLAASLLLPRLERAVVDPGACRDVGAALADGLARHVEQVRRLVPEATVVVQLDEPALDAVLTGRLPTSSGFGRLRAVEETDVVDGLARVRQAATDGGASAVAVHCCADRPPVEALLRVAADGLSLDTARLGVAGWELLAPALENGLVLWAGCVPTSGPVPSTAAAADGVWTPWRRLGLAPALLEQVVVTPACGLAGASPTAARAVLGCAVKAARELEVRAQG